MTEVSTTIFIEFPLVKSFLFECAKYWASEGNRVTYISNKEQQELPPSIQTTKDITDEYAEFMNITFVTAPHAKSLIDFIINLQISAYIPKVLVIEDITSYVQLSESPDSDFLLICSLLKHITQACWRYHKCNVFLIISIQFVPDKLNVMNFILNPRKIWRTNEPDDESTKTFILQEISTNPTVQKSQTMEFSLIEKSESQFLRLKNIRELFQESHNFNNNVL